MEWMDFLNQHLGEHEIAGASNNPFIVALFKHTSYNAPDDETPWCAACACTALEENGYKSPHNASAISFATYGVFCSLRIGCVVVLRHQNGKHHITFCDEVVDPYTFVGLGGNQDNQIERKTYNRSEIIATRWPIK